MHNMADKLSWKTRGLGLISAVGIRAWMSTHRYRTFFYDPSNDPRLGTAQPRIYLFWHEYILVPLHLRGHCDIVMLLSRHQDAEVLAEVARHLGFGSVRGSSTRGGSTAILELNRHGKGSHLAITPDGPQGPRRQMASGAIYLASISGMPIVPMGFGIANPRRAKSWDQFAMPRLFSSIRSVIGPSIQIPPNLSRDGLEDARLMIERKMIELTTEAEEWAAAGGTRPGDQAEHRRKRVSAPIQEVASETHSLRRSA
jgi:lysophospholipid acyltransferase (LPLAT)-like uncharacterized protein